MHEWLWCGHGHCAPAQVKRGTYAIRHTYIRRLRLYTLYVKSWYTVCGSPTYNPGHVQLQGLVSDKEMTQMRDALLMQLPGGS